ncbi:hypothetical protein F511_24980 [Dorcoceras hygrometricum]|uniref:Uncharacterized protein n=1 Tax=Dorcoceras hygrometricum TaxID=472368 RepID=A0A2Z7B1N9_9LAMI|nr:hypothetical protein F511_24980 [Dorcoceras hygrometricum]
MPNPVHDQNLNSFVGLHYKTDKNFTESPRRDGRKKFRRRRRAVTTTATAREGGDTTSRGLTTFVTPKHIFGLTHRIMVKRLATSPHDPLGITDSACKNQSVMVSVQYFPFNSNIPIRSTTIVVALEEESAGRCVVPENSNAIIGVVTTGFECLPPSCDGLMGSEDHGPMISPVDTPCGYRG